MREYSRIERIKEKRGVLFDTVEIKIKFVYIFGSVLNRRTDNLRFLKDKRKEGNSGIVCIRRIEFLYF